TGVGNQGDIHIQPAIRLGGNETDLFQHNLGRFTSREVGDIKPFLHERRTAGAEHTPDTDIAAVREIATIGEANNAIGSIDHLKRNRLIDLLHFNQAGMRLTIRAGEAIDAEFAIVRELAEVATIGEVLNAIVGIPADAMIAPLPHQPANKAVVTANGVPVFLEAARAIPHGMGIFDHDERLGLILLALVD